MLGVSDVSDHDGWPRVEAYDGPRIVGIDLRRFLWVQIRISEDGRKPGAARITRRAAPGRA